MKRKQLLSDADARAARLRQLDRKIVAAYAELQAAEGERRTRRCGTRR
jgi:hypothetical protein